MTIEKRYTAAELLACERYNVSVHNFLRGVEGHPGAPPPGYMESYRLRHPMAPVPDDFPEIVQAWNRRHDRARERAEAAMATVSTANSDVTMSSMAFSSLVRQPDAIARTVADILAAATAHSSAVPHLKPRLPKYGISAGTRPMMAKAKHGRNLYGRIGGPMKGYQRAYGAGSKVAAGKKRGGGGGKAKGRGKKQAGMVVAAVSVPGVAVGDVTVEPKREETPLPLDAMEVIEEDVHMGDFGGYHTDDEDDGAAGGAIGWDGGEPVPVM
ncbi:hypothetical protein C8R44DRAFT_882408 [Mycena epipterygia]|nr:hypothetical protein C8R44DRAFT_882408 [Mycena epipterygia]